MTHRWSQIRILSMVALLSPGLVQAQAMKEDRGHVYNWNHFTDEAYRLHQRLVEGKRIREEVRTGGYSNRPDFYREVKTFDADNGRLLSVIQRERENPDNIHAIEVYVRDEQGRVVRDYSSTYLPDYRNAPTQTLVFRHRYNGDLHAFRSFDASNDMLYQRCEGTLKGKPVMIAMDFDELYEAEGEYYQSKTGILADPVYKACFGTMPDTAKDVLPPR